MSGDHQKTLDAYVLNQVSLADSATALTTPLASEFSQGNTNADDLDFEATWSTLVRKARSLPDGESQDKLITLLTEISKKGVLKKDDGTPCKHWAGTAWTDLPAFGATFREMWNEAPPRVSPQEWTNINAFAARCTRDNITDLSLYAIWSLRDALETSHKRTIRDEKDESKEVSLEELLPAAAAWIEIAGSSLYALTKQGRSFKQEGKKTDPSFPGEFAKNQSIEGGFNAQRWNFWKSRFQEVGEARDDAGGREKLAKIAYQGMEAMKAAEK